MRSRSLRAIASAISLTIATCAFAEDVSTIAIPIRATLAPLLPLVEAQVPKAIENSRDQRGFPIEYRVVRDPIALQMSGASLRASTTAHYSVKACPPILSCVSCGVDEPMREAKLALSAQLQWDQSWRLRSTTTAEPATFPNRCEVTSLGFDITDRVIAPVVDDQLRKVARAIDENAASLTSFRSNADQVWTTIQIPYEISPRTWLVFEPIDAGLSPLAGQNLNVSSTLSLTARTRVVVGERPVVSPATLPPLQSRGASPGFTIPFDISVPYADATALANAYAARATEIPISQIVIGRGSGGRIAVDADVVYKDYRGPVHLEGTPRIERNSVTVPDLDFALDENHKSTFMKIVDVVGHNLIRARLREAATFSLATQAATARDEITKALTRDLAHGAKLRGRADAVRADSVASDADAIRVHVVVTGIAAIEVTTLP